VKPLLLSRRHEAHGELLCLVPLVRMLLRNAAMLPLIAERRADIAALCQRFGVRRLAVFGSAARGTDFEPHRSDVDFVVAFERPDDASLQEFLALRDALSATVGRPVDLVIEGSIRNPFVRAGIERSLEAVYGS
jgi:predicted nucleotidyltransferase